MGVSVYRQQQYKDRVTPLEDDIVVSFSITNRCTVKTLRNGKHPPN